MNAELMQEKALQEAIDTVFSSYGEFTAQEVLEKLEDTEAGEELHEELSVWEPFEYYDSPRLTEVIYDLKNQFIRFGKAILEEANK